MAHVVPSRVGWHKLCGSAVVSILSGGVGGAHQINLIGLGWYLFMKSASNTIVPLTWAKCLKRLLCILVTLFQYLSVSSNFFSYFPPRKYTVISSPEQRQRYKNDFNAEYSEYRGLHARIEGITRQFTVLDNELKQLQQGTNKYKVDSLFE